MIILIINYFISYSLKKMKVLIFLFFLIFLFSFQTIQAAFYCEDLLPDVYLIDPSLGTIRLGGGDSTEWTIPNIFKNLQADQGIQLEYIVNLI